MKYVFKNKIYRTLIPIFDILGTIAFFPSKLFRKQIPLSPQKILIIRLDHIGDFVCTTPLFKNIKKRFPGAKITVLINSASKDMAYRDPNIDKVIIFSPFYLARGDGSSTVRGLFRVIKDVRSIGFDLGIEPRGDILSIIIMWLGRVKYRAGYGITGGGFLLNKVCRYDESKHVIDRNLALLEVLDIPVSSRSAEAYFSEKDEDEVERLLRGKEDSPNQREIDALGQSPFFVRLGLGRAEGQSLFFHAVVLHPFAGAKAKEWTRDKFQELINRLKKDGRDVLLVGSESDEGQFTNVIDLRGRLNLPQLVYLIKAVGLFIGLDSGPANIAAAQGVPSVIICSGTNIPQLWIPDNPNVKFVYKNTECKPCGLKVCVKEKHECMEAISVDDVLVTTIFN